MTPGAPHTHLPPGGRHWYGPVERVGYPNAETFRSTYRDLGSFLDSLLEARGSAGSRPFSAASARAR